jgi:ribonuclease III
MDNIFEKNLIKILKNYQIEPKNIDLYKTAFTHKSINSDPQFNYERLEFLGDSIIKLIVTQELFNAYPKVKEGILAKKRAIYVQDLFLANLAKELNLQKLLICGTNENKNNLQEQTSILGAIFESFCGAIFLDHGFKVTEKIISSIFKKSFENIQFINNLTDNKTILQEITQAISGELPNYEIVRTTGPDHQKSFKVTVSTKVQKRYLSATEEGKSVKAAEQKAANLLIGKIKKIKL